MRQADPPERERRRQADPPERWLSSSPGGVAYAWRKQMAGEDQQLVMVGEQDRR